MLSRAWKTGTVFLMRRKTKKGLHHIVKPLHESAKQKTAIAQIFKKRKSVRIHDLIKFENGKKVPGKAVFEAIPGNFLVRKAGLETAYQNGKCTATDFNAWIHRKVRMAGPPQKKKTGPGFAWPGSIGLKFT